MPLGSVQLFTSNRLEILAGELAARVSGPVVDPLQAETIVVQSRGMATWLEQELARRNGVAFHCRFPFPRHLLFEIFAAVCPELSPADRFAPNVLLWSVHEQLGRLNVTQDAGCFGRVLDYLRADASGFRRFQLAQKLARLFDDYLTYRPEMILAWEADSRATETPEAVWQAELWRRITRNEKPAHLPRLLELTLARLTASDALPHPLPTRLSIFGISTLAPAYLRLFDALARHVDIAVYQLTPCREHWGDLLTPRETQRLLRRAGLPADAGEAIHAESGHRLLTSLGKQGARYQNQLAEFNWLEDDEDRFQDPGAAASVTRLQALQSGILQLASEAPLRPAANDRSVQVHSCHTPLRELQVLRDQMLHWFDHSGVEPREVLVLAPQLEVYAPLIPAVFGEGSEPRIPFTVADRALRRDLRLVGSFLHLLEMPRGRFTAGEVFSLLEDPAVQRRFGFGPEDLELIRGWLHETPVWWGFGSTDRTADLSADFAAGTWRRGLDRLLLGHAMGDDDSTLLQDIAPLGGIAGERALCAGRLSYFVGQLHPRLQELRTPRPLGSWANDLSALLTDFFAPESDDLLTVIRQALGELRRSEQLAGVVDPVPLEAVTTRLRQAFDLTEARGGFLSGGVTFCALQPMRSVPAKVICVLGLSDEAFPRRPIPTDFDLVALHPRPGDESRTEDDRYLFLETILSARQALHLSYVGQSARDNSTLPPSVVVSELLEALAQQHPVACRPEDFITRHPLHPFNAAYFTAESMSALTGPLFSYSAAEADTARRLRSPRRHVPDSGAEFCVTPLSESDEPDRSVSLEDLARFLANPAEQFVIQRLNFRLPRVEEDLPEREIFDVDSLQGYQLRDALLDRTFDPEPADTDLAAQWRATGRLPLGEPGQVFFAGLQGEIEQYAKALRERGAGTWVEPVTIDLSVDGFRLVGSLNQLTPEGLLHYRAGEVRPKDELRFWVELLALATLRGSAAGRCLGWKKSKKQLDGDLLLTSPAQPETILTTLLHLYWRGLHEPVSFFPAASREFAKRLPEGRGRALFAAEEKWFSSENFRGEGDNEYVRLCFSRYGGIPLGPEFEALATLVWQPWFDAIAAAEAAEAARKPAKVSKPRKKAAP